MALCMTGKIYIYGIAVEVSRTDAGVSHPPGVPFTSYYVYGVSKDHDANKIGMHPFSPDMHDACLSLFGREDPGQQSLI